MGPFDAWPTGGGGSSTSTASSAARPTSTTRRSTKGTTPIEPPKTPEEGYHFTEDMTDKAIAWVRQQKALMPDKPFFIYFAPGATHAPAPRPRRSGPTSTRASSTRLGRAARGDVRAAEGARRRSRRRRAHPPPRGDPRLGRHARRAEAVLARQMEVYAGFLEHTDHHIGRLVDALEDLGILDDTLVYYIIGDNGASRRGHRQRHLQRRLSSSTAHAALETPGIHGARRSTSSAARRLQPLRRRLGARDGHAVPVDQAGRLALGRHAQRHDRALAGRHQGQGRDPAPVPPRHRRRADHPRGRRPAGADDRQRRRSRCRWRASAWPTLRRRRAPPSATRRSTSRCSATAASTTRAGRRSPGTAPRG